jgi:hypothetical protein
MIETNSMTDDLLQRIKRANATLNRERTNSDKADANRSSATMQKNISSIQVFLVQIILAATWAWEHLIVPVTRRVIWRPIIWLLTKYRQLWYRVVHVTDAYGQSHFSVPRAGGFLMITAICLWFLVPLLDFFGDACLYALTVRHRESIYLSNSQELDAVRDLHSIEGAEKLPMTPDDTIYFRVENSWFNSAWSIAYHMHRCSVYNLTCIIGSFTKIFFPEYVAAAVPPVVSECSAISYGFRFRFVMRWFNFRPKLLEASCTPVTRQ